MNEGHRSDAKQSLVLACLFHLISVRGVHLPSFAKTLVFLFPFHLVLTSLHESLVHSCIKQVNPDRHSERLSIPRVYLASLQFSGREQIIRDLGLSRIILIFPAPHVIAHRRDLSLRDVLVHTSDRSQTEIPGTFACRHPRCRPTSMFVDPRAQLPSMNASPANQITLYTASRAVDAPSSTSERPVELYMNVSANIFGAFTRTPVVPLVAEHFNSPGQSLSDIAVRGLRRCSGASFRRKQLEMQLIFRLGTMQPDGLNNVFHFL